MSVRKSDDSGYSAQADGERPLKRKIKGPRQRDGRTLVDAGTYVPRNSEGYSDSTEDEEVEEVDLAEVLKNRQQVKPLPDKEHFNKVKEKVGNAAKEQQKKEIIIPTQSTSTGTAQSYQDGVLHIMSNGTPDGTIVTLNGQKLDVKIIMNLNIMSL